MEDYSYLIIVLVLLAFISIIIGIFAIPIETEATEKYRFETIYDRYNTKIIVDTNTNVSYLVYEYSHGVGITTLLDAEGKPIIFDRLLEKDNL